MEHFQTEDGHDVADDHRKHHEEESTAKGDAEDSSELGQELFAYELVEHRARVP